MASLNATMQLFLPGWVRARGLSTYQIVFVGGQGLAALGWGLLAQRFGLATAFLVAPAAMGQRLVRAKAKIKDAGIPFALPSAAQLPERLTFVLDAIYVAYGTGWDDPTGSHARRRGLTEEALRLARLVTELLPGEPEAHGLLATLLHTQARDAARRGPGGAFVPLDEQDVRTWSPALMAEAERHLVTAARRQGVGNHEAGPYRHQAAIQSMHNRRAVTGYTDWPTTHPDIPMPKGLRSLQKLRKVK